MEVSKENMAQVSKETWLEMYRRMHHARNFEEKVSYFFSRGMIHGTTHLSAGEEASSIAAAMALEEGDLVTSTHRGHSQIIGMGVDLNKMMAELFGKATGYCKGKGGSMHIADIESGNLGANGVVGGGHSIAVGAALTQQYKKTGKIVLCFFGDGASNEGSFHESLNLASVWKLPVIFYCENNLYGMSTHVKDSMNVEHVATRAAAYNIPGHIIDGNNAIEVHTQMKEIAAYVRSGQGPVLVESKTYRYMGHSKSDANAYRTREEIESWKEKDPLPHMRQYLIENQIASPEELTAVEEGALADIEAAIEFANNSPNPAIETVLEDVYA